MRKWIFALMTYSTFSSSFALVPWGDAVQGEYVIKSLKDNSIKKIINSKKNNSNKKHVYKKSLKEFALVEIRLGKLKIKTNPC